MQGKAEGISSLMAAFFSPRRANLPATPDALNPLIQ
jgi:hypothetical protein